MANKRVKAPAGFHWMKSGSSYKLMKNPQGGFKPHKGASVYASFKLQKIHKKQKLCQKDIKIQVTAAQKTVL